MFNANDPPATSAPLSADTSLTVWAAEFPATQMRPSEVTVKGVPATVNAIPTQPLKLLRKGWLLRL